AGTVRCGYCTRRMERTPLNAMQDSHLLPVRRASWSSVRGTAAGDDLRPVARTVGTSLALGSRLTHAVQEGLPFRVGGHPRCAAPPHRLTVQVASRSSLPRRSRWRHLGAICSGVWRAYSWLAWRCAVLEPHVVRQSRKPERSTRTFPPPAAC